MMIFCLHATIPHQDCLTNGKIDYFDLHLFLKSPSRKVCIGYQGAGNTGWFTYHLNVSYFSKL